MLKHPIPKRVPAGVILGGTRPLLTIDSPAGPATALFEKSIGKDKDARAADRYLLEMLLRLYGGEPFQRGNLDAGRLNRLFGREIKPVEGKFHVQALGAYLRVDVAAVRHSFPDILE